MNKIECESFLTKEECETILTRYFKNNKFELLSYKFRPLSENVEGFLGEHLWLEVETKYENKICNLSFFTKCQPKTDFMREFCRQISAFESEICFYEKLIPEYKKYYENFEDSLLPTCYFSKENCIILENCVKADFQIFDTPDVLTLDHIKIGIKACAKLHAGSIIYEERKSQELKRPYSLLEDYEPFLKETFYRKDKKFLGYKWHLAGLLTNLEIIDKMTEVNFDREEFKQKYSELAEECCSLAQPSKIFRNVCCHADLWRNNIMFKYENDIPIKCKFLDFQLMKYYPPAYDILKFLHQTSSPETRHHHFDDLMDLYYHHLCLELKLGGINPDSVLSRDEFQASIKYMLGYVKIEASYYYHFQRVGGEFLNEMTSSLESHKNFIYEKRQNVIDRFYTKGSYFQKWMDELLLEIYDIIYHDNFSREDCRTMIKNKLNSTNYELLTYDVKYLNEQNGFLGAHKQIKAIINLKNQQTTLNFFAKFLPTTKFNEFAISSGAFDNELFMYERIFKMMHNLKIDIYDCVPNCYFARRNDVLVFDDLIEFGYQPINKHKELNYKEVLVVLSSIAKLHASSLILEEKLTEINKKTFRITDEFTQLKDIIYIDENDHAGKAPIKSIIKGFHTQIDLFPDPISKMSVQELKKKVEIIFNELMYEYSKPSKKYRNVLCHGDLWASNILLKYDKNGTPVHAKLVDFQCIKKCPPAQDVMAFIYLATTRKFRLNYMNDILKHYYQELKKFLEEYNYNLHDILTYKEFLESCDYYKVFAISQTVSHFHFIMCTAEDMDKLFKDDQLCHKTFYIDRSEFILKMCNENPTYKLCLSDSLKDFRQMCENYDI